MVAVLSLLAASAGAQTPIEPSRDAPPALVLPTDGSASPEAVSPGPGPEAAGPVPPEAATDAVAALSPADPSFADVYAAALKAKADGQFDRAAESLRAALALQPTNGDVWFQLALVYGYMGRYAEALDAYRRVLALAPDYVDARIGEMRVLSWMDRTAEAIAAGEAIRAQYPDNFQAALQLGRIRFAQGDHAGAQADFTAALAARPENPAATIGLGDALWAQGEYNAARIRFRAALDADPGSAQAQSRLERQTPAEAAQASRSATEAPLAARPAARSAQQPIPPSEAGPVAPVRVASADPASAAGSDVPPDSSRQVAFEPAVSEQAPRPDGSEAKDPGAADGEGAAGKAAGDEGTAVRFPRLSRLDFGYSHSRFDGNTRDPWNEAFFQATFTLSERLYVWSRLESARRGPLVDYLVELGGDITVAEGSNLYLAAGVTPSSDFLADVRIRFGGSRVIWKNKSFFGAGVLTFDARWSRFAALDSNTWILSPGFDLYMFNGRVWTTLKASISHDTGEVWLGGVSLRANWQLNERLRLFAGAAYAPESDLGRIFEVRSVFLGGVWKVTDTWELRADYAREDREDTYRRNTFTVGAGVRF